jgi:hypothetical protein
MEESAIRKAAAQMMELHGNGAELAAASKADAMLNQGNIDGFYAWNRISAAINDLDRKAV